MALTRELTVYDNTLGAMLRFLKKPAKPMAPGTDKRFAPYDNVPLRYRLDLSAEAYDVLQKNPLLKQKIQLDMLRVGEQIVRKQIVPLLAPGQAVDKAFLARVEQALKRGEPDVQKVVDDVLKRHAEMNKAWGDYYKSMRKDLIFMVVGLAMTATSVALAVPTGGASLVLAIISGAKSVADGVKKLGEAWRTAEEQQQRLHRSIKVLLDAYVRSVHQGRAMQVTGALLDTIGVLPVIEMLPFVRQQLMPSMTKINGDMTTYKGKLGSLYDAANRLAAELFQLLDAIDEYKKANPGGTMPKLDRVEKRIAELLDTGARMARFRNKLTISGAFSRYENGMGELQKLQQLITQLNGIERHPRAIAIIGAAIKVFGNVALTGGAYGAGGASFDGAKDIASFSIGLANDVISTTNDFIEFGETAKGDGASTPTPPPTPPRPTPPIVPSARPPGARGPIRPPPRPRPRPPGTP